MCMASLWSHCPIMHTEQDGYIISGAWLCLVFRGSHFQFHFCYSAVFWLQLITISWFQLTYANGTRRKGSTVRGGRERAVWSISKQVYGIALRLALLIWRRRSTPSSFSFSTQTLPNPLDPPLTSEINFKDKHKVHPVVATLHTAIDCQLMHARKWRNIQFWWNAIQLKDMDKFCEQSFSCCMTFKVLMNIYACVYTTIKTKNNFKRISACCDL